MSIHLLDALLRIAIDGPKLEDFDSSKLKEFADDSLKFDKHSWKLSKSLENTLGKGEIARLKQFLLFPQCFQEALNADM